MEILTSINRPLSIWGKDAPWLKQSTKSQETKDKSKALRPLPLRTGKGEPAHPPFILEATIGLLFISILRAPTACFQSSPQTQTGSLHTHGCHIQDKWGNKKDWWEQVSLQWWEKECQWQKFLFSWRQAHSIRLSHHEHLLPPHHSKSVCPAEPDPPPEGREIRN